MGFNTVRKHVKVEPDRWYYHCDKIGLLVWQDMVQPGDGTTAAACSSRQKCGQTSNIFTTIRAS